MAQRIQIRRDTAANWTSANPILAQGEQGLETDTLKFKIGNGSTAWTSLAYLAYGGGGSQTPWTSDVNAATYKLIGGTGVTDVLKLQSTTGNGTATSPAIQTLVGNNGNTTAMTILNNGNVGIGTTTVGSRLVIQGSGNTSATTALTVQNSDGTGMVTIQNGGNVGIGITSPTARLQLVGPDTTTGVAFDVQNSNYASKFTLNDYGAMSNNPYIIWGGSGVSTFNRLTQSGNTADYSFEVIQGSTGDIARFSNGTVLDVISNNGNVGIGTTSPSAYLHLKASTASANTGALKFTAGVVATTPEAGLIEFDGTDWYLNV